MTDLYIKLPGNSHRDLVEVKVHNAAESCILPLRAYRLMDCPSLMPSIIPESYTDGILPIFGSHPKSGTLHKW